VIARNPAQAGNRKQRLRPAITHLNTLLERAERIRTQQPKDKNKLYALHAPEVECIGKGKARKPYEFGVKASIAVTHKSGLMVGARTFPGNPYDGTFSRRNSSRRASCSKMSDASQRQVVVDLGFRGVDRDNPRCRSFIAASTSR
jgi:IS5 family transposase